MRRCTQHFTIWNGSFLNAVQRQRLLSPENVLHFTIWNFLSLQLNIYLMTANLLQIPPHVLYGGPKATRRFFSLQPDPIQSSRSIYRAFHLQFSRKNPSIANYLKWRFLCKDILLRERKHEFLIINLWPCWSCSEDALSSVVALRKINLKGDQFRSSCNQIIALQQHIRCANWLHAVWSIRVLNIRAST